MTEWEKYNTFLIYKNTSLKPKSNNFKNLNISNLVMESGVHSSLHQNCHYQIIYAKINLKMFYPPPSEREVWHYQRANVDLIQRAIKQFSSEKSFRNLNINEMVFLFNKTIKNIFHQKLESIQIQLSSSYNERYKRDVYRETLQ